MNHLLYLFHSEDNDDILDVDLHMLQALLVVFPSLKFYKVSTVYFNKYGGRNLYVTNYMSHYSMFVPIKATVKLAIGNTVHAQLFGITLCPFPNCPGIYIVVTVYYCPGHPSNTISLATAKCYVDFQKVVSEPI